LLYTISALSSLMAPFFGAGGLMQLCLQCSCRRRLHRSSGLQKAQGHQDDTAVDYIKS